MRWAGVGGLAIVFVIASGGAAGAQTPFGIVDNSFLVEEAFNQEAGVFQNIANWRWQRGQWIGSFTQEWPVPNVRHQLSFSLPFGRLSRRTAIGDVLINYRLQLLEERDRQPAFSPRISVILPSGSPDTGLGAETAGWQFNLPFSKRAGSWYFHWNAGATGLRHNAPGHEDHFGTFVNPAVAASAIWRALPTLNLLVEVVGESIEVEGPNRDPLKIGQLTIAPGFRCALNFGEKQLVLGLAAPVARSEHRSEASVFAYFSYELPFR